MSVRFKDLKPDQQRVVARRIAGAARALVRLAHGGGGYEAVEAPTSKQRKPAFVELTGEDGILTAHKRGKLTDLSRQAMRNGPERRAIDHQRRVNIVGTLGGKLTCNFPGGDVCARWFNSTWAPHAGFVNDTHFNNILKLVVQSIDTDGDCALVFDDGFITGGLGTGRVRAFETDEIASLDEKDFKALVGADHTQSQGVVFDSLGAFCGVVVSTSQRGRQTFTAKDGAARYLQRDPFARDRSDNWIFCASRTRFNQGRGISPLVAAINTLTDIHEIAASETQSAKVNSQLVGQIISDAKDEVTTDSVPDAFKAAVDAANAEVADGSAADGDDEKVEFSLEEMEAIGAHFDEMPAGKRFELLDTKRPNPNMAAYLDWLVGTAASTLGMPRLYAMLRAEASYSAARAEMCLAWTTFEECQKELERTVCDWIGRQAIAWAVRTGELRVTLPPDWHRLLSWSWPKPREIDETKTVSATREKLRLGLTTYRRELGPDYKASLEEWAAELKDFEKLGLPHPALQTVAGAVIEQPQKEGTEDENPEV
ncbi:MAG: phage portal protein [Kiritimatiellae bacterium]|nr:phage portal protein [Kiritimatiellia bacterium]